MQPDASASGDTAPALAMDAQMRTRIEKIIAPLAALPGALLPILHAIQDAVGFVPPESVALIADALNLSRAEVHGVISFYHDFRSGPPGRHVLKLCRAEACQAMGARQLEARIRTRFGIPPGETTTWCAQPGGGLLPGQLRVRAVGDARWRAAWAPHPATHR